MIPRSMAAASVALVMCACAGETDFHNQSQEDVLPYGEETLADATVIQSDAACAAKRRVRLLSHGIGLRIETYQVVDEGCIEPPDFPAYQFLTVSTIEHAGGRKTYMSSSSLGALWIHDDRQNGADIPWRVVTYDYESNLVPGFDPWASYYAPSITDYNQAASGNTQYWVRVRFNQPLSTSEVHQIAYSLLLDPLQSTVVPLSDDMTYDLLVLSDFQVAHVLAQFRASAIVYSAELK